MTLGGPLASRARLAQDARRMALESPSTSLAAVDLGSNSFHMIIGRLEGERLLLLDRLREPVRMAAGLDESGRLSPEALERVLAALRRFGQRLRDVPPGQVRAVGTYTLRETREPQDLLERAGEALGVPIEILGGAEEARLIHLGVSHDQPPTDGHRLVVDIGGGSTECILGKGFQVLYPESLQMGCVHYSRRFFPDGKLTRKAFGRAEIAAKLELETLERRFRAIGWSDCVGSSGTALAVAGILREKGWTRGSITPEGLEKLRKAAIAAAEVEGLLLPGLQPDRATVLPGGLAILRAVFDTLGIESMTASKAALRDGLLYDLLGRIRREDVRDRTIRALSERFSVDQGQAERVWDSARRLLDAVALPWGLASEQDRQLLEWAARMHEVGLALAYSGHHKHGAYILASADMPGFSREDQEHLAAIVRGHRRKLSRGHFAHFPPPWPLRLLRLCVLLRLAVRLERTRSPQPLPAFGVEVAGDGLVLRLPEGWLEEHPLTVADLEDEAALLASAEIELRLA